MSQKRTQVLLCLLWLVIAVSCSRLMTDDCNCLTRCRSNTHVKVSVSHEMCEPCEMCQCLCPTLVPPTMPPNECGLEGYELVTSINRCLRIGSATDMHDMSIRNDLTNYDCGPGAELLTLLEGEANHIQQWAWRKVGSVGVSFWTQGRGYKYYSEYYWRESDYYPIADFFEWHNGYPPDYSYCVRLCGANYYIDFGPCDEQGLHYICQKKINWFRVY